MRIIHFPSLACLVVPGEGLGSGWGSCASLGAGKEEPRRRCSAAGEHRGCWQRLLGLKRCCCCTQEGMGEFAWGCWPCPKCTQLRAACRTWGELYLLILLFLLLLAGLAADLALEDLEPLPVWVGGGCDHDRSPLSGAGDSFEVLPPSSGASCTQSCKTMAGAPLASQLGVSPLPSSAPP